MSFLPSIKTSFYSTPNSCHQYSINSDIFNQKVIKLIKSKLSPLKIPIKKVRKSNHISLIQKIIINHKHCEDKTLRDSAFQSQEKDKKIQSTHSFTDLQRNVNKKAQQYIKKRKNFFKKMQKHEHQKQKKPLSTIQQFIQLFETQMRVQKDKKEKKEKNINRTIIQDEQEQKLPIFMTQQFIRTHNKTIKNEMLQDIKKQFDQEKQSNLRINMNHKKIISRLR